MPNHLKDLRLYELSLVDNPANKQARVTLYKRAPAGKTGLHTKESEMDELKKRIAELEGSVADVTKKLEAASASVATLTKERDDAIAKATAADAKATELQKAADIAKGDESFVADGGIVVKKSEVGDTTYKLLKSQHEKLDLVDLTKRAEADIGNLPGEPAMKARIIKAIDGIGDEAVRKAAFETLKAADAAMKGRMKAVGEDGETGVTKAEDKIEKAARKYQADNKIASYPAAYDAFLKTEEGRELYAEADAESRRRKAA